MHFTNTASLLVIGAIVGIALVLSCSDHSPRMVDAADLTCNCPLAEPPIPDRIVQIDGLAATVPPNGTAGGGAVCPLGAIVLGGGCAAAVGQVPQIILEQSIPGDNGWDCSWRNPTNAPIVMHAIVRCLKPAP